MYISKHLGKVLVSLVDQGDELLQGIHFAFGLRTFWQLVVQFADLDLILVLWLLILCKLSGLVQLKQNAVGRPRSLVNPIEPKDGQQGSNQLVVRLVVVERLVVRLAAR